jgi:DNA-binding GntR family transcriptional regulator
LQQEQGVSRGTVRMAVAMLRDEGLVVTIGGRGTFVSPNRK